VEQVTANKLSLSVRALDLFISNFMPTLFLEDDFICLQSCFALIKVLLRYHDPQVFLKLQNSGTTPELYATSWFFTFFANKCGNIELALDFWSRVIQLAS
jgi:hypothetical protein